MSYAVGGSGFLNNLGRIYAIYTGTFAAFVVLIGIRIAKSVITDVLSGRADPFVVELGSNDGIMLRHFHERGIRHLGVEREVHHTGQAQVTVEHAEHGVCGTARHKPT